MRMSIRTPISNPKKNINKSTVFGSYMCDLKRKAFINPCCEERAKIICRHLRCWGTRHTRNAFRDRQDCIAFVFDRGISAVLPRKKEINILFS